jgi:hypothetical protein
MLVAVVCRLPAAVTANTILMKKLVELCISWQLLLEREEYLQLAGALCDCCDTVVLAHASF